MEDKNTKSQNAEREEKVLKFWEENKIFQKSLDKEKNKGEFVFYEGPPTANGKPGIHHLEARAFKDAIPRYKTMQGFHVRRKGGWDTHGLPVELQVEKKLGLNSKKAIEDFGIAKFNTECKASVWEYLDIWNRFTKRIGYWVDQENPYVTYDNKYIESVWNVLGEVEKKDLLYKDYRIVPWCPRCGTALSSHELAQGYEDVKDLSVTAKFRLFPTQKAHPHFNASTLTRSDVSSAPETYILAWTTTPWTLPGNVALAVGSDIDYVKIKLAESFLILAKERLSVVEGEYELVGEMKGSELVGLEYEPLYPYLRENLPEGEKTKLEKAFKVYAADFVTTTDGTGVVHTAVMYGQDDFELGTKLGLPKFHIVGLDGRFVVGTGPFEGRFVKDEDVAIDVIKDLAGRGLLFKKEKYEHSYPHCWRCKTPLIYYARDSWYIRMSSLRAELLEENKDIKWEPSHIREGRFGEWLREIKDWAISRERYWGTPLPIWMNEENGDRMVINSVDDIRAHTKKSGNKYFVIRHGEAAHNLGGLISDDANAPDHLTDLGREQVVKSAQDFKDKKIDLIFASPFVRTEETTDILCSELGLSKDSIVIDDRLHEFKVGNKDITTWKQYHEALPKTVENFTFAYPDGESYQDMKNRVMDFIYDIESKYQNKNIVIVTHCGPSWILSAGARGHNSDEALSMIRDRKDFHYLGNAEYYELNFSPLPHDSTYTLDLHRPYIDEVVLEKDGARYTRVKEVMDVWFDSGCMPFAQDHYPFENRDLIDGPGYPADYICEAIDQTRGWFYTLHAVGILMGKGRAYKNVICLGHILDAQGKKMSKSLGNIVDPWTMMEKYGVDTLRLWMYSVNQPGESKNFDEKTVAELHSKVFGLYYNVLSFYELYRDTKLENVNRADIKSDNVLDQWILAQLDVLVNTTTINMDNYKLLEPVRAMRAFMDDLSTWYLRRSRERIKDGEENAKQTLYVVLKTLAQIMAPFAPFTAEDVWQKLKTDADVESVHLSVWPENADTEGGEKILSDMQQVRDVVTLGLQQRQKAGIPVRQPLSKITVKVLKFEDSYIEILKDELNVKSVSFDDLMETEVFLDTEINAELKKEGQYRELVRAVQDLRKKTGLMPADVVTLFVQCGDVEKDIINTWLSEFQKTTGVKDVVWGDTSGDEVKIGDLVFVVKIEK